MAWRTIALHDREVVDALVDPVHTAPSPELAAALREWPGSYYWSSEADGRHLILTRPTFKPRESWTLHAVLLLATLFTTTITGAIIAGQLEPTLDLLFNPFWDRTFFQALGGGFAFSVPLLAILLCHELGHYLTARHYQLNVSPPFFLPGPPIFFIGTFGAFIRLRTVLTDRRQLLDVGAAGPLAGFIVAIIVFWYGLAHSQVQDHTWGGAFMSVPPGWIVGDSLISLLLRHATGTADGVVSLHPTAFAGWLGMLVTMLNLLPIAQLDGGHILYAALPRAHRHVARAFWVAIVLLGYFSARIWLVWGIIVLLLSRGRFGHPPVLDAYRPLPRSRLWLLVASAVLFIVTFTPVPSR